MKKSILIICCTLLHITLVAQLMFNRTYNLNTPGNSDLHSYLFNDSNGYIAVCSSFDSAQYRVITMVHTDWNGNITFKKNIPKQTDKNLYFGALHACVKTFDNNYVAGGSHGFDNLVAHMFLTKFDYNGDTLWYKEYFTDTAHFDVGNGIAQCPDSGFVIVGYRSETTFGSVDWFMIRTDKNGDTLWTKRWGINNGSNNQEILDNVIVNDDGTIVCCGYRENTFTDITYLFKLDSYGNILWQANTPGSAFAHVFKNNEGDYLLYGARWLQIGFPNTLVYGYHVIYKYNDAGILQATHRYGHTDYYQELYDITQLPDSSYAVVGTTGDSLVYLNHGDVGYLMKLDKNLDSLWSVEYNDTARYSDVFSCIIQTPDSGFLVSGFFNYGEQDMWLVKTNSQGCDTTCTVGLNEITPTKNNLLLYPNPASNSITVRGELAGNTQLIIYNTLGQAQKTVALKTAITNYTIDCSAFNSGFYVLKIIDKSGGCMAVKFIVEK